MPVSPGASGMQPRDPCRPWRGTLASGHKPRGGLLALQSLESNAQLSFATRVEDWTCLGQHKRHPEFPVVTRESRRNSRKTTCAAPVRPRPRCGRGREFGSHSGRTTATRPMPAFHFDNSYARDLGGLYVAWKPAAVPQPRLLFLNRDLAAELGLDAAALAGPEGAAIFAGNRVPDGAEPIAQAYAGHQFGGFSPQLGDGRALLLGEVIDRRSRRRDIAFKGSGRTPFARGGDGKAAVGPMLREVIIGEAMHALGIPTTRALAVVATGEPVDRKSVV